MAIGQDEVDVELYLLAVSPLTMLDEFGRPCGIQEAALAKKLGVNQVKVQYCSTAMVEFGGYNRTWQCRAPAVRMYDQGSIFHIVCDRPPMLESIRFVEQDGLGIRREEGFGQVLFLRSALFEGLSQKSRVEDSIIFSDSSENTASLVRQARCRWIIDHAKEVDNCGLSRSQLGTIQALCEKEIASYREQGTWKELKFFLEKNMAEKNPQKVNRFRKIDAIIRDVLSTPMEKTLQLNGVPCEDSIVARLQLLCQLINFSRKGKERERA